MLLKILDLQMVDGLSLVEVFKLAKEMLKQMKIILARKVKMMDLRST
jgi:hypothetical protein